MKSFFSNYISILYLIILVSSLSAQSLSGAQSIKLLTSIKDNQSNKFKTENLESSNSVSNIKIVESRSINNGHTMDLKWQTVAAGMGHNATIVPQTTLDDNSFFSTTDVLIISSGLISIPTNRVNTIKSFLMSGKNVYMQCEYQSSFSPNQAFSSIVNSLGGTFIWGSSVSGDLIPMQILGSLSLTPNNVPYINDVWFGLYGTGNNCIEYFMKYQSNYFGFIFTSPNPNYGILITSTDQDWIRGGNNTPLMQNILSKIEVPLPVMLSTFTASVQNNNVNLTWTTDNELNNYGFDIERKTTKEGSIWQKISFVKGNGTKNEISFYTYEDKKLSKGAYNYRLKQIDYNSNYEYYELNSPSEVVIGNPVSFSLSQNYPNPSNPKCKIDYTLPKDSKVKITVYDILGREVLLLVNENKEAGYYTAEFDGTNLASGVYYYKLVAGDYTETKKMILVK